MWKGACLADSSRKKECCSRGRIRAENDGEEASKANTRSAQASVFKIINMGAHLGSGAAVHKIGNFTVDRKRQPSPLGRYAVSTELK